MKKVFVARLDELASRMGKEVIVGEQKIAVYRLSDDRVKAIENVRAYETLIEENLVYVMV